MIQSNDLRIGNKVISRSKSGYEAAGIVTVSSIGSRGINAWQDMGSSGEHLFEELDGMPLTPEFITKFGFDNGGRRIDEHGLLKIELPSGKYEIVEFTDAETYRSYDNRIEYVHQLQNLFYALSDGIELKVNL